MERAMLRLSGECGKSGMEWQVGTIWMGWEASICGDSFPDNPGVEGRV